MTTAVGLLYTLDAGKSFFDAMMTDMVKRLAANLGLGFVSHDDGDGYSCVFIEGTTHGDTPDVRVYTRAADMSRNDSAPSVVCIPLGGEIVPPNTNGEQRANIDGRVVAFNVIRDRLFATRVYLWGESRGQAEVLLGQLILAFQGFHNQIEFGDEKWETEQDDQGGEMTSGTMISFLATVRIAVTDLPTRLVRVTKTRAIVSMPGQPTAVIQNPQPSP